MSKLNQCLFSPYINKLIIPAILGVIVMLASCNKDKTSSTTGIEGTYKFKNFSAYTQSSIADNMGDKIVTLSNYTATDNGGTLTFANNTMIDTGLTYSVNTQAEFYEYYNDALLDSASYPFNFMLPPGNSTGQYQLVGADIPITFRRVE